MVLIMGGVYFGVGIIIGFVMIFGYVVGLLLVGWFDGIIFVCLVVE